MKIHLKLFGNDQEEVIYYVNINDIYIHIPAKLYAIHFRGKDVHIGLEGIWDGYNIYKDETDLIIKAK